MDFLDVIIINICLPLNFTYNATIFPFAFFFTVPLLFLISPLDG